MMFILPPPPKYYGTGAFPHNLPALEATNSRTVLDQKIQNFSAPEGVYTAQDCLFLATPLPHPSDPPPVLINPLAPTINQPSSYSTGVRVSTLVLRQVGGGAAAGAGASSSNINTSTSAFNNKRKPSYASNNRMSSWTSSLLKKSSVGSETASVAAAAVISTSNHTGSSQVTLESSTSSADSPDFSTTSLPLSVVLNNATGLGQFSSNGPGGGVNGGGASKRKPKNSLTKNNSSFISRTIVHENLSKRLQEHTPDDIFIWANVGRSLSWISAANPASKHEALTKILFTKAHPLCHDINTTNASMQNLEVVIGTSAGDIIWIDAVSNKYNRINKNGDVTRSPVTSIKWIPGSDNFFVTGHADGSLAIFDKERDNSGFSLSGLAGSQDPRSTDTFKIIKSFTSGLPTATPSSNKPGELLNPIGVYKVSNSPLTSLQFSPNGEILSISSNDGYLRLLDLSNEQMYDIFPSYYGGFICTAFSPDGEYFATGGQDDMVCVYSVRSKSLVARLQGHKSWVRQVCFDPWGSDAENYRLGSIGEDGTLLLWDFSPKTLTRPKIQQHARKKSFQFNQETNESTTSITQLNSQPSSTISQPFSQNRNPNTSTTTLHSFISQHDTPILLPVVKKSVHVSEAEPEPLSDLVFLPKSIQVVGKDGRIWTWDRPSPSPRN